MFENIFRNAIEYKLTDRYQLAPFGGGAYNVEFTDNDECFVDFVGTIDAIDANIHRGVFRFRGFISKYSGKIRITGCDEL